MAKRGLCILLAVLTLFALAVPAFAAETSSGKCGDNVKWSLSGGTLTISGKGKMKDYSYNEAPWSSSDPSGASVKKVVVKSGVTSIGSNAFSECWDLESVTLPSGVTSIGDDAFGACSSLTSVTLPSGVTAIGAGAFSGCTNLKSVTVPDSVTSIGDGAFSGCYSLTGVTIPDRVTSIGINAFRTCQSLKSVTIPGSVKSIGGFAFFQCSGLTSVKIPEKVTSIGEYAFFQCVRLKSVTVPASVTSIGEQAFANCQSLASVTIENPKCTLAEDALSGVKTICGYTGSTAQTYAKENKITFKSLGKAPGSPTSSQLTVPTVKIAQSGSSIKVTWNKVSGSAKYMVYYKENGGSWKKIGATAKTSYTRAASKLKNGAVYQFAVRCCASDGKTFLSGYKASNKLTYAVKLTAPTVKVSKTGGGIQVTWNKVKTSPLYMVYYRENGGKWKQIGATAKTSYTRAAKNLKNGVTYQFTVRCVASDKKTFLSGYKASGSLKYKK